MIVDAISVNEKERTRRNIEHAGKGVGWSDGSPERLQGNQKETMDRRKERV